jgi:hypothetical protein
MLTLQKRHKLRKIVKIETNCQKIPFGGNLKAPNLKWRVWWTLAHFLTPLGSLRARPYRSYQGFSIFLKLFLSFGASYSFFQIIQNKVEVTFVGL